MRSERIGQYCPRRVAGALQGLSHPLPPEGLQLEVLGMTNLEPYSPYSSSEPESPFLSLTHPLLPETLQLEILGNFCKPSMHATAERW